MRGVLRGGGLASRVLTRAQVGQSAFAFLFSEFIQYSQARVNTADELQQK
jgi:hypothetical protein